MPGIAATRQAFQSHITGRLRISPRTTIATKPTTAIPITLVIVSILYILLHFSDNNKIMIQPAPITSFNTFNEQFTGFGDEWVIFNYLPLIPVFVNTILTVVSDAFDLDDHYELQ
jgi:hypothetical protein